MSGTLQIVMYHYVRDFQNTAFPCIKGMPWDCFIAQLAVLRQLFEMATLESALDFMAGKYRPSRDLCLLTFDDGLREHYTHIAPLLAESKVQGIFFPISSCMEQQRVVPTHMNHFLMAALDFEDYRRSFLARAFDGVDEVDLKVDRDLARRTYRWDTDDVAAFKYLLNFAIDPTVQETVIEQLFVERLSDQASFAKTLYFSWEEAKQMQSLGMVMGGHSDDHRPLARLDNDKLRRDLNQCRSLFDRWLKPQPVWPFSYPYGKENSYSASVISHLIELGFGCAFSTVVGCNQPGGSVFELRRLDCKDAPGV